MTCMAIILIHENLKRHMYWISLNRDSVEAALASYVDQVQMFILKAMFEYCFISIYL